MIFNDIKKIHFIGIGGIGVSGIAKYLIEEGYEVSGSDLSLNSYTAKLEMLGAKIYKSHSVQNLNNPDLIIYSSAVKNDNPEYAYAIKNEIRMIKRGQALAEISKLKRTFAVAGTHGKTTTSSILASILNYQQKADFIIGGKVLEFDTQALNQQTDTFVIESDESDGSFLLLEPDYTIVTNIDSDHIDYYKNTDNLLSAFKSYLNDNKNMKRALLNLDDKVLFKNLTEFKIPYFTYAIENQKANFIARNISVNKLVSSFDIFYNEKLLINVTINLIGNHNVSNALAAFALTYSSGVPVASIKDGLLNFKGVSRRLELLKHNFNFELYDDYAHHPTEIECALQAVKLLNKRSIVFFEPHRYTRTRDCWDQFIHCFKNADDLYMLPIYSAGENEIEGINTNNLIASIKNETSTNVSLFCYENLYNFLSKLSDDVVVICLGAGPISKKFREISCGNLESI